MTEQRRTTRQVIVPDNMVVSPPDTKITIPQKRSRSRSLDQATANGVEPTPISEPKGGRRGRGASVAKGRGRGRPRTKRGAKASADMVVGDLSDEMDIDTRYAAPQKAMGCKGRMKKEGEEKEGEVAIADNACIPPEPTRRSGRIRVPPKNPYNEQLAATELAKRTKPSKVRVPRKKKIADDEKWAPENLITKHSPYATADLGRIMNAEVISRANMSEEDYDSLCALLPANDLIYPTASPDDLSKPDPKPSIDPKLFESAFFKEGVRNYQADLGYGKYEPSYIAKGQAALQRRLAGEFDDWKDRQFELHWGDKQKFYYDTVAGESSKVKLQDLVKHHQFRIGDVFSMRRSFIDGIAVRKDAVLTHMDTKSGNLSFSYPPGTSEWTRDGISNKSVEGVASLSALETLLLREDNRAPSKIPNGNAFKTIRVLRKGEDIGCVFDVRAKFWHQYLAEGEEQE